MKILAIIGSPKNFTGNFREEGNRQILCSICILDHEGNI